MKHDMRLLARPFELMRSGAKTVEIRLNDEKRRKIQVGDTITFRKLPEEEESIVAAVEALYRCSTFEELFKSLPFEAFGCAGHSMDRMLSATYEIYTPERESKYGALGIKIKLL